MGCLSLSVCLPACLSVCLSVRPSPVRFLSGFFLVFFPFLPLVLAPPLVAFFLSMAGLDTWTGGGAGSLWPLQSQSRLIVPTVSAGTRALTFNWQLQGWQYSPARPLPHPPALI